MHVLRRLAAFLVLTPPISLLANAGATWGAAPVSSVSPRIAHVLDDSMAIGRDPPDRTESAVVLLVLDGVRWQDVFGGADRALARQHNMGLGTWATPRALMPNLQ